VSWYAISVKNRNKVSFSEDFYIWKALGVSGFYNSHICTENDRGRPKSFTGAPSANNNRCVVSSRSGAVLKHVIQHSKVIKSS
jgi:hypothetical protein